MEQKNYLFPSLLKGEEGTLAILERPQAAARVKYIVVPHCGKVLIAEWIHVSRDSSNDYILVAGWVKTEPYRLNNGQLRMSVLPLTKSEQQECEELVKNRFLSDLDLQRECRRNLSLNCNVVFWSLEV